jgi:hypothetical protein
MAFPDIKLGSTFDAKGFKQAESAVDKLGKNVKNLAKTFGLVFGTAAVVRFGKASAKAFMDDEAAANRLTTAVKNLGLGFEDERIKNFVSTIESQTGVLDDKLRPALQSLLATTGSVAKSQELLRLAIDVAAGSGEDLSTVANDLSQAYVGNTKGLKKYYLGLTQAELKAASFTDVQKALTSQFSGSNASYLGTYAGQLDLLGVGFANMQETIGKGLLDSFALLAGDGGIPSAISWMDRFAKSTSDATYGLAALLNKGNFKLNEKDTFWDFLKAAFIPSLQPLIDYGAAQKIKPKPFQTGMTITGSTDKQVQEDRKRAAAEAEAARRAKELLTLQNKSAQTAAKTLAAEKKRLLLEKAKAALTKAAATFDLTKISIAAALKATYDKDERLRLLAMQAIENDNGEAALEYIRQLGLLTAEQQTNKLAGIKTISETELNYINQLLLDELQRIKTTSMSEEEAALARQAAYAKYNAAIQQSGGLAEANFYSEKTQAELLAIAKLASLDKVAAAQATMNILNYTTQTDIIAKIAAAQKIADDAKMQALREYLALLASPVIMPTPVAPPSGSIKPPFGIGGQPIHPGDYWDGTFGTASSTGSMGSVDNSVTVIVEGNVLNSDDFDEAVSVAMRNAQRTGYSQYAAGSLP